MDLLEIKRLHQAFLASSGVTTDSRNIAPGSMFFALKGENFDGNAFAASALEKGAACAVVSSDSEIAEKLQRNRNIPFAEKYIPVEDTLTALQLLARYHRSQFPIPVIALTGTNGKTTTKELLCAVLSAKYRVTATVGNLNNHIGVPLTLLRINAETEIAVVEMGASHPHEIERLVSIALPNCGLITNVGKAHLEGFGSFDGVRQAKGELYDYIQRTADIAFYNVDNGDLREMVALRPDLRTLKYGVDFQGVEILPVTDENPYLRLRIPTNLQADRPYMQGTGSCVLESHLVGNYNADNMLAALNVGAHFSVPLEKAVHAIADYIPSNNRSQLTDTGRNLLVLDTYNANPSSMKASLDNFRLSRFRNKRLVLGDMLELGKDSLAEHRKVISQVSSMDFQRCCFVGREFMKAGETLTGKDSRFSFYTDVEELAKELEGNGLKDCTFLIKGSNGIRLPRIKDLL